MAATPNRSVLSVTGPDRESFLQGLVSNDVGKLKDGLVYAALLNAQGKYLVDFFLVPDEERILIDVAADQAPGLLKRLTLYRLRAKVAISMTDIAVSTGLGPAPAGGFADPRHDALGWRGYNMGPGEDVDWDAIRVAHKVPETGIELIPDDSYLLEMDFERLHGVDFRKGCYVGQEVTARMKHKTQLRKGLARVTISGAAELGAEITRDGKPVGRLWTRSGDKALAYLRFDRAQGEMQAGEATLTMDQS